MRISELGEFGLIDLVARRIAEKERPSRPAGRPMDGMARGEVLIGIGDDTAVWRTGSAIQLATTDTLVEGVHFTWQTINWYDLGWKSLAVNLSDIASMGAVPTYALVTLGLPADTLTEDVVAFYDGLLEIAGRYGTRVVGGDMVGAGGVLVTVALCGEGLEVDGERQQTNVAPLLRRSAARPGDLLGVTGYLGSAAGGLRLLLAGRGGNPNAEVAYLCAAHQQPVPRVAAGQELARRGVRAAMDISDGLAADLGKLCLASGVAATVRLDRLPIHPALRAVFGKEAPELALGGGEDYELLFAAPSKLMEQVAGALPVAASVIGEVVEGEPGSVEVVDERGRPYRPRSAGWDHYGGTGPEGRT